MDIKLFSKNNVGSVATLFLVILLKPIIYDSWRHFLFLTVLLIIISIYGLYFISLSKIKWLRLTLFLLITLNIVSTIFTMKYLHPYEYVYYNSTVGGLKGAFHQYETDYWGESYKEAVVWFNKNINNPDQNYLIKTEGDPYSSTPYFMKNMTLVDDQNKADYVFTFTRWNLDQAYSGKIIYQVVRYGIPLVIIKEGNGGR